MKTEVLCSLIWIYVVGEDFGARAGTEALVDGMSRLTRSASLKTLIWTSSWYPAEPKSACYAFNSTWVQLLTLRSMKDLHQLYPRKHTSKSIISPPLRPHAPQSIPPHPARNKKRHFVKAISSASALTPVTTISFKSSLSKSSYTPRRISRHCLCPRRTPLAIYICSGFPKRRLHL